MTKIAVLGHGVVGSGTVELFLKNKDNINKRSNLDLELGYILDIREFPDLPYSDKFTKNIEDILNDNEVRVAAEVMGGIHPAFEFTKSCLERGISVCTSNKALVAEKGAELMQVAKEHNCNYMFEASTGGAIPVIRPLVTCLAGNEISAICGILNGTTNFILTKMTQNNMAFDDALSMAQKLGYAEKDPTADIEGHDACRKICILSSLAFGKHVYPEWVHCEGITKLTLEDSKYAENWGGSVKLIGSVKKTDNGKILPIVRPAFVCGANQLSHIDDVFNGITLYGDGFDEIMLYGRGAGKLPTASAVVGDIIDCAKLDENVTYMTWEDSTDNSFIMDYMQDEIRMYIRTVNTDKNKIEELFGNVEYLDREGKPENEIAFITGVDTERSITDKIMRMGDSVIGNVRVLDI